jgi:hypothetical protein
VDLAGDAHPKSLATLDAHEAAAASTADRPELPVTALHGECDGHLNNEIVDNITTGGREPVRAQSRFGVVRGISDLLKLKQA